MGMGYGVGVDQTFPAHFGKIFSKLKPNTPIEIINVNLPGHPLPKNMQAIKDIFYSKIKPDLIIYGSYLYDTDLAFSSNAGEELTEKVFGAPLENDQDANTNKREIAVKPRIEHSRLWKKLSVKSLLMAKFLTYLDVKMADIRDNAYNVLRIPTPEAQDRAGYLYDLDAYLSNENIPLLIVDLPHSKNNDLNKEIEYTARLLNIPYLSVRKLRKDTAYTWVENGHYSEKTNEIIGEDIAKWANQILDDELKIKLVMG